MVGARAFGARPINRQRPTSADGAHLSERIQGNAIQVLVDGAEVFKLGEHQMTTFALPPGHHQVSAQYSRGARGVTGKTATLYWCNILRAQFLKQSHSMRR